MPEGEPSISSGRLALYLAGLGEEDESLLTLSFRIRPPPSREAQKQTIEITSMEVGQHGPFTALRRHTHNHAGAQ